MKKATIAAVLALSVFGAGCYDTPDGGEIGVVRNGGPFDDKNIRQVVDQGSGNTWVGWFSETHFYPAADQQRLYKFDSTEDADAGPVTVFTRDGVKVTLTGTFYLNTAFDNSKSGQALLEKFDTAFGTRGFGPEDLKPWEEGGWSDFLNAVLQPVIDSNIREVIATFDCEQLVSSCALVQRDGALGASEQATTEKNNASNVEQIQTALNENLDQEITAKLKQPYFGDIRFSLGSVKPNQTVQAAIDDAQAEFAKVSKAQARVESAKKDREANTIRQKGYNACSSCAKQDELKSLPDGLQALGGDVAVGLR